MCKWVTNIDNVFQQSCSFSLCAWAYVRFWKLIVANVKWASPNSDPLATIWQIQPCLGTVLWRRRAIYERVNQGRPEAYQVTQIAYWKSLGDKKWCRGGIFFPPRKYQYMQKATQCETVCITVTTARALGVTNRIQPEAWYERLTCLSTNFVDFSARSVDCSAEGTVQWWANWLDEGDVTFLQWCTNDYERSCYQVSRYTVFDTDIWLRFSSNCNWIQRILQCIQQP